MSRSRWRILFGISVLGNVTGPDPASLRCAGQELANCIMIQSTKSAPSIAPEVALATPATVLQMHCLLPVAQRVSTKLSSSVQKETGTVSLPITRTPHFFHLLLFCWWEKLHNFSHGTMDRNRKLRMRDRN